MKIWGNNPRVFGVSNQPNPVRQVTKQNSVAGKRDEFSISTQAKDYQVVMKALRNVPDIRQGKVQEISGKIEAGQYDVTASDISQKLIKTLSGKED